MVAGVFAPGEDTSQLEIAFQKVLLVVRINRCSAVKVSEMPSALAQRPAVAAAMTRYPDEHLVVRVGGGRQLAEDRLQVGIHCRIVYHSVGIAPIGICTVMIQHIDVRRQKPIAIDKHVITQFHIPPEPPFRSAVDHDCIPAPDTVRGSG